MLSVIWLSGRSPLSRKSGLFARLKIARYIAEHPPVQHLPCFYIVLLGQSFAPMEPDGMTRVYQV